MPSTLTLWDFLALFGDKIAILLTLMNYCINFERLSLSAIVTLTPITP